MSFNAKNLSYELKEPSFLRKLKSEYGSGDAHRHERQIARPKRLRDDNGDDDEPTYVDEESLQTLTKDEYTALVGNATEGISSGGEATESTSSRIVSQDGPAKPGEEHAAAKEKVASIGGSRKSKPAKVIRDSSEEVVAPNSHQQSVTQTRPSIASKPRKGKKIKLSFSEEESNIDLDKRLVPICINYYKHWLIISSIWRSTTSASCFPQEWSVKQDPNKSPEAHSVPGNVFERRLIEAYLNENGKDPVNGEELTTDDLVELKSARVVRPRPPTLTSIPSLLSTFQNEWDALALETYTLRQQLAQTRQELSTALYQHDAATRVIARMKRERDEARDALSKVTVNARGGGSNGDQMQVDNQGLPDNLATLVDATQENVLDDADDRINFRLSKTRRKRPIPEGWVDAESISSFSQSQSSEVLYPGSKSIALDASTNLALVGGADGVAGVYSISENTLLQALQRMDGAVTDTLWWRKRAIVAGASGEIRIYEKDKELATFRSHAGPVTSLALHPSGEILASVGEDKSFIFYDLSSLKPVSQVFCDSGLTVAGFHPDGHLFAAGSARGEIKVFDVKSGSNAANFETSAGSVKSFSFSENGTWLAAVNEGSTSISIWDLRKAAEIKTLEVGSHVERVQWDYTGQFLAAAGSSGVIVQSYSKSTKLWSETLRSAVQASAIQWGELGQQLVSVSMDGIVHVLSAT
ncbi:MAG: hypothetical protein M1833_007343 [Piccolia ochrophora]|nr:MAG: hypothetical protein M1833_007343 [Piccolia ochrophora]